MPRVAPCLAVLCLICCASCTPLCAAQVSGVPAGSGAKLQFVVYLSRHGVRSPTGNPEKYNAYSAAPWPAWSVPPGYLTARGYQLMKLFGAYDRARLAAEGLLASSGCADAAQVTILADSDQRTRQTGMALAEGLFPGCSVPVHARPEGAPDPLFHFQHAAARLDPALAQAAIDGRIGGDPANLTEVFRPQLQVLDSILAGCGRSDAANPKRISIFSAPVAPARSSGSHMAELRGPLSVASSMAESLLLEYAEGFAGDKLGWDCLNQANLRQIMQLHTAEADFSERTPAVARMLASNLLDHILEAIEQSAAGKPVPGAPGRPGDRVLFLVGHDTNIATVAGALGLDWILDGRFDDTPPGGALVFELWRSPRDGEFFVRVYYTAQTLRQMREMSPLTLENPPPTVPLFVPGCKPVAASGVLSPSAAGAPDFSCSLDDFASAVRRAIDPAFVLPPH